MCAHTERKRVRKLMKTRDLVRAHIAGDRERVMREAVFHDRLLSGGKGQFVTGKMFMRTDYRAELAK
jgi:hypothetical protein